MPERGSVGKRWRPVASADCRGHYAPGPYRRVSAVGGWKEVRA